MKAVLLSLLVAFALSTSVWADAPLTFTGGNNTPLTMTLGQTITYNITSGPPQGFSILNEPLFVFSQVSTPGANFADTGVGTITFSVNGGAAQPLTIFSNLSGAIGSTNLYLEGTNSVALSIGDVVQLHFGSITGSANFPIAPPASGPYTTYISAFLTPGPAATQISDFGVAVPEPASVYLLIAGLGGLLFSARKMRRI